MFRSLFGKGKTEKSYRKQIFGKNPILGVVNDPHTYNFCSLKVQRRETIGVWFILLCHVGLCRFFQVIVPLRAEEQKRCMIYSELNQNKRNFAGLNRGKETSVIIVGPNYDDDDAPWNKPHKLYSCSPEPHTEVYWFRLICRSLSITSFPGLAGLQTSKNTSILRFLENVEISGVFGFIANWVPCSNSFGNCLVPSHPRDLLTITIN